MSSKLIPKGIYCYDDETGVLCPYWREHTHVRISMGEYTISATECEYLKLNTINNVLKQDYITAYFLFDKCKICGEKLNDKEGY